MNLFYRNFQRKHALIGLVACSLPYLVSAQTQPVPQTIPYIQNFDSFTGANNVNYPAGMQGWQIINSVPSGAGRNNAPMADITLTTNGSAVSTSTGIYDFNGKIGVFCSSTNTLGVALALNTSNIAAPNRIRVNFDGSVIRNVYNAGTNNVLSGLILQYRIGTSGTFTNAGNSAKNGTTTQTTGTNGIDITNSSFLLPLECSNQPVLQLRWTLRAISGSAGDRPSLAIDNIEVVGEAPNPTLPFNGYVIESKNITLSNSSTTYATNILKGVTRTQSLSTYGGAATDFVGNTSGYFKTYKDARDVWYMVDPSGYKFYSIGINTVIEQKGIDAISTIKSIYSNTISNFSDETLTSMPYCVRLNLGYTYRTTSTLNTTLYNNGILAVFDPAFVSYCTTQANSQITAARIIDKNLLGYFSDNEVPLANSCCGAKLIDVWLNVANYGGQAIANNNPNYQAAVAWIKSRNGNVLVTPTTADRNEWPGQVAEKYYQICRDAIKARDPNHLYIGSRLHQDLSNRYQFEAAGKYVDILSVNNYNVWTPAQLSARYDVWEQYTQKPFIVTEFYAQGDDSGLPNASGAGFNVSTQQDRADFFEHYTMEMLKRKWNVGFHYFKLNDDPAANNKGLLNTDYNWWEPMRASFTKISQDIYELRRFLIFNEQTLPITLKSYTAKVDANKVRLEWTTLAEINNDSFEIQRSNDGIDFKTIYTIKGKGNSVQNSNYISYDNAPLNGSNYYKLIQYDLDGTKKELGVRAVNFSLQNDVFSIKIYPNPSKEVVNVQYNNFVGSYADISIIDLTGKLVHKERINTTHNNVHQLILPSKLKTGQYILQFSGAGIEKSEKILIL